MNKYFYLILFVLLCLGVGGLGSVFTTSQIGTWYTTLVKPGFNPPNWIFGPVWTTLYVLMGMAMYLVFRRQENPGRKFALWFFTVHLAVNLLWSVVFFTWHQLGWALAVIILLWLLIAYSIYLFGRISKVAGWVLVPYLAWVSFASCLNFAIWSLNK